MLQVARLAPRLLGESSDLVRDFVLAQLAPDGGFVDRAGRSDLYYTVFGLESLLALQAPLPVSAMQSYLQSFGAGEGLDFIHLCCLTHCWAALATGAGKEQAVSRPDAAVRTAMINAIERHRTSDGGYGTSSDAPEGSAYGCFVACSALQNLGCEIAQPQRIAAFLDTLKLESGAYANDAATRVGATPATAAAVTLLRQLDQSVDQRTGRWLLSQTHPEGGFVATPGAPMPDLLSTAVALQALSGMQMGFERVREACLDFIDTLWTNQGSFHGNWADEELDVEYTYYGLLALGHLSL